MLDPLDFAIQLARRTGQVLLEHLSQSTYTRVKADKSVVTDADMAADRLIANEIQNDYPGEPILSEELHPKLSVDPSGKLWVIDPLDGTTNYSLGLPYWGISIARLVAGQPETGVLYFPLLDELYTVQKGKGAQFNGNPLKVMAISEHQNAAFFSCCSRTHQLFDISIKYKPRILGSAAYSLCTVARGIALISFEATPKVWDIAAAWLLINEVGGAIDTFNGSKPFPLQKGIDYSQAQFPTIAAATRELLANSKKRIIPKNITSGINQ